MNYNEEIVTNFKKIQHLPEEEYFKELTTFIDKIEEWPEKQQLFALCYFMRNRKAVKLPRFGKWLTKNSEWILNKENSYFKEYDTIVDFKSKKEKENAIIPPKTTESVNA